jgi:F-type H+-transporting ATPase subunit a
MMPENKGLLDFNTLKKFTVFLAFTLFLGLNAFANKALIQNDTLTEAHSATVSAQHEGHTAAPHHEEEAFNPGKMIIEHVKDAHDWHILDYTSNGVKHPVSVPLPVIIYDNGLHVFMSSKFEHGHATVESKGQYYKLHEGHIYKTDAAGIIHADAKGKVSNVAPMDLSMTKNVLSLLIGSCIICLILFSVAKRYKNSTGAPKGIQSLLEPIIIFLRDEVIKPSVGHHYAKFLPLLLSIFFFIFINNLMGLIPIFPFGANLTLSLIHI